MIGLFLILDDKNAQKLIVLKQGGDTINKKSQLLRMSHAHH